MRMNFDVPEIQRSAIGGLLHSTGQLIDAEADPYLLSSGAIALPADSGVRGARIVNAVLGLVHVRSERRVGSALRASRAELEVMRCDDARSIAVHDMVIAMADFALGEASPLDLQRRVAKARMMWDDALMVSCALLITLHSGEVMQARTLANEALAMYGDHPMVLRQVVEVYKSTLDFPAAIAALQMLHQRTDELGGSWASLQDDIEILSDLADRADAHDFDTEGLLGRIRTAIDVIRAREHTIFSIALTHRYARKAALEIEIDGGFNRCFKTRTRLLRVLDERFAESTSDVLSICCRRSIAHLPGDFADLRHPRLI